MQAYKTADPEMIIGAVHTAPSARILAGALEKLRLDNVELILPISSDKNLGALLDAQLPQTRRVWASWRFPRNPGPAQYDESRGPR
jgi:folylpolyglutamate synthase/dihydropteroate synthase